MSNLRAERMNQGLTLTALALAAQVEPSMLSLIERGKRPAKRTADKLAAVLRVNAENIWPEYHTLRAS